MQQVPFQFHLCHHGVLFQIRLHQCHLWTIAQKLVPQIFDTSCNKKFGFMGLKSNFEHVRIVFSRTSYVIGAIITRSQTGPYVCCIPQSQDGSIAGLSYLQHCQLERSHLIKVSLLRIQASRAQSSYHNAWHETFDKLGPPPVLAYLHKHVSTVIPPR